MTKPFKMPQAKPSRPIQGRYSKVARKWRSLSSTQSWDGK